MIGASAFILLYFYATNYINMDLLVIMISHFYFLKRNNELHLLKQRLDILKAELRSLMSPSLQGSEWLFSKIDPMIQFFGEMNIITKGETTKLEMY